MKKSYIVIGGILLLVIIVFFAYRGSYNTAVSYQEDVDKAWGDVGASYQRRADLVPQLIATVKGAAANEKVSGVKCRKERRQRKKCTLVDDDKRNCAA